MGAHAQQNWGTVRPCWPAHQLLLHFEPVLDTRTRLGRDTMPGWTQVSRDAPRMIASCSVHSWMLALPVQPCSPGPLRPATHLASTVSCSRSPWPPQSIFPLPCEASHFPTGLSAKSTQLTEPAVQAGYRLQVQFTLSAFFIPNEIKLPRAEKEHFPKKKLHRQVPEGEAFDTEVSLNFIQPTQRGALSSASPCPQGWFSAWRVQMGT